ncbi:hypothetical protein [Dubosiella newyorkensis]|uniref:hypothetical protein n=1 Tax=Dubosiella newyorkensis TaxID=1862672 RepID=UPI003F667BF7
MKDYLYLYDPDLRPNHAFADKKWNYQEEHYNGAEPSYALKATAKKITQLATEAQPETPIGTCMMNETKSLNA